MERILKSGGNGSIGSHLAEKAFEEGFYVKVIDNFSTY